MKGAKGAERKVRAEFADGQVDHYNGAAGTERKVHAVFADGEVLHFEGAAGAERMTCAVSADGRALDSKFVRKLLRRVHMKTCSYCGKRHEAKLHTCNCHAVRYCNRQCQRSHWAEHKLTCEQYRPRAVPMDANAPSHS